MKKATGSLSSHFRFGLFLSRKVASPLDMFRDDSSSAFKTGFCLTPPQAASNDSVHAVAAVARASFINQLEGLWIEGNRNNHFRHCQLIKTCLNLNIKIPVKFNSVSFIPFPSQTILEFKPILRSLGMECRRKGV